MTQGPGNFAPLYCPRCGGLMSKPTSSTLYWHASLNHPRCEITNIVETLLEMQLAEAGPPSPEPSKPSKGLHNK